MAQTPIPNMQASLALTEYFPLTGIFPSGGGGGTTDFFLGEIGTFAGNFVPAGVGASGQILSIGQNTAVFSLLGPNYGGNGQSTFALPNLNGTTMVGTGQGPGLSPETIGEKSGLSSVTLHYGQTPPNSLNPFGQSQSFDNRQPSLGITYEIATLGVFPSPGPGGSTPLDTLGMIMAFAGNFDAGGYMACDGRLLSIAQNNALFSLLGTTYGGDGVTTFALPDLRGRDIIGASATDPIGTVVGQDNVTLTNAQTPNGPGPAGVPFDNRQPSLAMEYLIALQGIFPSQGGNQDPTTPFLGQIVSFAGTFVPGGWALCDGSLLSINQNQALFAVLGTTYGGNGTTTFALPDLRDKTVIGTGNGITLGTTVGANSVTITADELPVPQPRFGGALVTPGQFGAWAPLGSTPSGSGYQVVWRNGATDQYIVWNTDSSGNWLSQGPILSGTSYTLQSLETTLNQDLNGDGTVGPVVTTIEAFGATDLKHVADTYFLYAHGTTTGPQMKMSNAAVTMGQFGAWTPLGAEQMGSGYLVVWKNGAADQYIVWNLDGSGNWLSQSAMLSGASAELQSLEPGFNQDLNGVGGITPRTVIESSGSTTLANIANAFVLSPNGSSLGPQIRMSGALVMAGQFGNWTPIGAEQMGSGYLVVWKNGAADQYIVWNLDGNGNWVSQSAVLSGASTELQVLEPGFNQDLNGVGGISIRTVIEAAGSTTLAKIANTFVVSPTTSALGQQLKMSGAAVTAGQFGNWTPLGAEQAADGTYQVVWKNGALDQYTAWNLDSSGNFISQGAVVAGGTWYVEMYESSLHQDLNSDGTIGPVTTTIETAGATTLTKVADSYFFNYGSGGPQLMMNGAYVAAGQFGNWTPLGAEQAANGTYQVAWKNGALDQYTVWETDGAGNYLNNMIGTVSGTTSALQQFEPMFHQDLNGDGVIPIEAVGSTKLVQSGNNYVLDSMASLGGPLLKYSGANVNAGQFGAWTPIAAEQTASGYEVAWKNGAADQYTVWNTDSSGNWLSQGAVLSGSSVALESLEPSFQQDLNGDGTIGVTAPNMALFANYIASAFATPAGEGTGAVADPQSSPQPFLAKSFA